MEPATKARALSLTAQTLRHTRPAYKNYRQMGALIGRFTNAMAASGVSGQEARVIIASACIGREIHSFKELFGGEVTALLEEPDLPEIVGYVIKEKFGAAVN